MFLRDRTTNVTERASVSATGAQANGVSSLPAISADGGQVAFESTADNLVAGDTNGAGDIFLRDRASATTERVSVNGAGGQGNGLSSQPALAGFRYVAFTSAASNLVPQDTNGAVDVFLRDRVAGTTELVSTGGLRPQANGGSAKPALSADGRFVAFASDAANLVAGDNNRRTDVFVRDRQAGSTTRVSVGANRAQGNRASVGAAISADGRFVAFMSLATNLVEGDGNGEADVFVHDREAGTTQRVSVGPSSVEADGPSGVASISGDGNLVAFESGAANLVVSDTNGRGDVFVRDRAAAVTERVSVGPAGAQATRRSSNGAISQEGFAVAFESPATNLVDSDTNARADAFVRERPRPTVGQAVNVLPTRGKVLISLPRKRARGSAAVPGIKGRNFVSLKTVRRIPVGSLVDVRNGALKLTSARNRQGAAQTAEFSAGVFQVLQSRKRSSRGLTELRLKGSSFRSCRRAKGRNASAQTSRRRRVRRLRGRGKGRFRTRGRHSSATVRGTDWTVTDRCDGTLTTVKRGRVAVRDFRRRRTIVIRAGKRYLARTRR